MFLLRFLAQSKLIAGPINFLNDSLCAHWWGLGCDLSSQDFCQFRPIDVESTKPVCAKIDVLSLAFVLKCSSLTVN